MKQVRTLTNLAVSAVMLMALVVAPTVAYAGAAGAACTGDGDCATGLICGTAGTCAADTTGSGATPAVNDFGLGNVQTGLGGSLGNGGLIQTIAQIINVALGLLGIVAVVIILIGGFRWMTAAGREDQIDGAKKTIFAGIIGLAIILSAWAIATFVITSLSSATGSGNVSGFTS